MKMSQKQKVTLSLDVSVYQQLVAHSGKRGVGAYISNLVRTGLPERRLLDEGYEAMAVFEANDAETAEWLNADIDAPLQD